MKVAFEQRTLAALGIIGILFSTACTSPWPQFRGPENNMVFVQVDNEENSFIVALEADSGNEIWKAGRDEKTNYSTPVIWKNKIRTELVTTGKTARSYDPATGKAGNLKCSPKANWMINSGPRWQLPAMPTFSGEPKNFSALANNFS